MPASQPIIGELTAAQVKPQVITNPIAVAVPCLNMLPPMATVAGNTRPIARPRQNTAMAADVGFVVRRIANGVTAISTDATNVTVNGANWFSTGATATGPLRTVARTRDGRSIAPARSLAKRHLE